MIRSESLPAGTRRTGRMPGLTTQIFIGLLVGIAAGYLWPSTDLNGVHTAGYAEQIKPLADVGIIGRAYGLDGAAPASQLLTGFIGLEIARVDP